MLSVLAPLFKIIWPYLSFLAGIGVIFFMGKRSQKKKEQLTKLKEFKQTTERINETPTTTNRDDALDRLRDNGQIR